ncbi:MAG: IS630 family transposase [Candidatus Aegiribacteria sp.]|nr:IS630 family transposase [Candidatus Aegiribacteria sp.]
MKKYIVRLSVEERQNLIDLVRKGKVAAYKRRGAQILLKADIGKDGPGLKDEQIVQALGVSVRTVERLRERLCRLGFEKCLLRAKGKARRRKLDGVQEAQLITLVCSSPPEGSARWTLRMLADKMVELDYVDELSYETVRQVPKKNETKPWQKKEWCIPPLENAAFVCAMENVLEIYHRPFDPDYPVVCMDESSKQMLKEVRRPIPARPGRPERFDTEYERNGTSNIFMFFEPLAAKRYVDITDTRKALDWAFQIKDLADNKYPDVKKIILVMDNLNTHNGASLYKAFPPEKARRILDRIEFHYYTPKHGSWLNMAEIELSVLGKQCLNRRIPDQETFKKEVAAWQEKRNSIAGPMNWRFTTKDARIKLKKLYPTI